MELMRTIVVFAVVATPALIAAYILLRWFEAAKHTPRYRV
jgi:phage shock protein PspC (stress-responsive transcriptional regulator)